MPDATIAPWRFHADKLALIDALIGKGWDFADAVSKVSDRTGTPASYLKEMYDCRDLHANK